MHAPDFAAYRPRKGYVFGGASVHPTRGDANEEAASQRGPTRRVRVTKRNIKADNVQITVWVVTLWLRDPPR